MEVVNKSGLRPLGHAVLVEPYEPEVKKSVIELPQNVAERSMMAEQRAIVIEVGPECWKSEQYPRARPGDKVILTKFAGHTAKGPADGVLYRLVNDRDVFCEITEEKS